MVRAFATQIAVPADPSTNLQVATKQYVDNGLSAKVGTSDSRLSDARTPTAHVSTHQAGGTDALLSIVAAKSASYTLVDTDEVLVFTTTSGAMTATLPTAVGRTGKRFLVKKLGGSTANPLTIATTSSQTIDGATTEVITVSGGFRELVSDGSNWHIIGGKVEPVIIGSTSLTTSGANMSIDATAGNIFRFAASSSATTLNLPVPTNGTDGDSITIELLASVATSITVNASILLTTGITTPIAVTLSKRWFGGLRYVSGVGWFLLASTMQA